MEDTVTQDLSIALYRYLCQHIVGTEDYVKQIRLMNAARDNISSCKDETVITSGSFGEGLDMRGTDLDIMFVTTTLEVYEDVKPFFNSNTTYFSMEKDDVKPGYAQLKLVYCRSQSVLKQCEEQNAYAYFLNFLCYYHLNDVRQCQDSLQGLQLVINEGYLMECPYKKSFAYNLLGVALQLLGDKESARHAFLQSVELWPNELYNSAVKRLLLMN
ncbi:unnamed protein product [Mytilus coruscus]|uniref:Uncharacterized protein n=1 Tax=Mytilus coruscus TaxID=42192 RepID=A0A6J8ENA3_MYTCO|nr:unnamed protein product [Mytilus coruscus]